jgi:hypothetical protein
MFDKFISVLLLSMLTLPISCELNNNNTQIREDKVKLENEQQGLRRLADALSQKMNNKRLDSNIVLENFTSGEKKKIAEILKTGEMCVLQYSELNCNICVDSAVSRFKQFIHEIGKEHAIIIAATKNPRYMISFVQLNGLQHDNVYMIDYAGFEKLYGKSENMPFVYMTNSSFNISDCFYPFKEIPEYSDTYYTTMYKKYFEEKHLK